MVFALRQKPRQVLRGWRCRTVAAIPSASHYAEFVPVGHSPVTLRSTSTGYAHQCNRRRLADRTDAPFPCPGSRWSPPMRKAYHVKPSVCFQVFSRQTASRSRLAILIAGEPPETRFPWAASFNPSTGSGFKPAANPSPIADTAAAKAPAAPAPQAARMLCAPSYRTVPQSERFFATQKIAQPAGQGKQNARPVLRPPGDDAAKNKALRVTSPHSSFQ